MTYEETKQVLEAGRQNGMLTCLGGYEHRCQVVIDACGAKHNIPLYCLRHYARFVNSEIVLDPSTMGKKHILHSIYPEYSDNYEGSQCWHGCDKVSFINGSGGGGS